MVRQDEKAWRLLTWGVAVALGINISLGGFVFLEIWKLDTRLTIVEQKLENRPPRWLVQEVENLRRLEMGLDARETALEQKVAELERRMIK